MVNETQKIIVAKEEPEVLIAFKKHREKFLDLLQAGVFDLQSGKAEVNINNGVIENVLLIQRTYKRETKPDRIPI